jgi:hypothetical protein
MPQYLDPLSPTAKAIKAMLAIGNPPMAVLGAMLLNFPQNPPIPASVLRYVFGPLVVHTMKQGIGRRVKGQDIEWLEASLIEQWRPRVDAERVEILCGERPDLVSPTEIWMVALNAMMTAPMAHDITQIVLWAGQRSAAAAGKVVPNDLLRGNSGYPLASDADVLFSQGWLHGEYVRIATEIIRKVTAHGHIKHERKVISDDVDLTIA